MDTGRGDTPTTKLLRHQSEASDGPPLRQRSRVKGGGLLRFTCRPVNTPGGFARPSGTTTATVLRVVGSPMRNPNKAHSDYSSFPPPTSYSFSHGRDGVDTERKRDTVPILPTKTGNDDGQAEAGHPIRLSRRRRPDFLKRRPFIFLQP